MAASLDSAPEHTPPAHSAAPRSCSHGERRRWSSPLQDSSQPAAAAGGVPARPTQTLAPMLADRAARAARSSATAPHPASSPSTGEGIRAATSPPGDLHCAASGAGARSARRGAQRCAVSRRSGAAAFTAAFARQAVGLGVAACAAVAVGAVGACTRHLAGTAGRGAGRPAGSEGPTTTAAALRGNPPAAHPSGTCAQLATLDASSAAVVALDTPRAPHPWPAGPPPSAAHPGMSRAPWSGRRAWQQLIGGRQAQTLWWEQL